MACHGALLNDASASAASPAGKIRALSDLVRPELPVTAGLCVLVGQVLALGAFPSAGEAFLGFLVGFLVSGSAMISNDYFDLEVDRVNHPGRPLPSGRVTVHELAALAIAFSVLGLLSAALLGLPALALALGIWALGLLYNWRFKESGLPGNLMVAASVASTFVFGGVAVGAVNGAVLSFAALAFVFDLAEEIAAGAMDLKGDEKRKVRTLARLRGKSFALRVSGALFAMFIALSFLPFVMGWLGVVYLVLIVIADAGLAYLVLRLMRSETPEEGRGRMRQLYLSLGLFIVAFIVSRLL